MPAVDAAALLAAEAPALLAAHAPALLTGEARAAAIRWETAQFAAPRLPDATETPLPSPTSPERVSPRAAYQLLLFGRAVLLDIRPEPQRRAEGRLDPAMRPLHVERRRLADWLGGWKPQQGRVLVLSQEGYASPVAAAWLAERGVLASDVVGGMRAWRAAGLPVTA